MSGRVFVDRRTGSAQLDLGVAQLDVAHVVQRGPDRGRQGQLLGHQRTQQLPGVPRADDRRRHARPVADPRQRDRQGRGGQPVGRGHHGLDDAGRALGAVVVDVGREVVGRAPGVGRGGRAVLAGEHAPAERGPRDQADPVVLGGRTDLALEPALQQRVLHHRAHDGRGELLGPLQLRGRGELPARVVRHPGVADLAAGHRVVDGRERLLDVHRGVPGVQLPQVDVIDTQPAQRTLERGEQRAPGRAAAERALVAAGDRLGGQHEVLPGHEVVDQRAQDPLGLAVVVDVGGVDERAAEVGERDELVGRLVGVGVLTPGHRAQTDPGHAQPALPEVSLLHGGEPYVDDPVTAGRHPAEHHSWHPANYRYGRRMRLGLNLGYWGAGNDANNLKIAQEADRLGYSVAWAAEAYGSDVPTVLSWVAAQTEQIDVGSAILQIPARQPTMAAMTAATLDTLSGGRFRMGLGVSGPQVSEGWYGVKFDKPLARTREYVEIVKQALRRERVSFAGNHFTLPLPDGPGKPLKLIVHPVRPEIPIYLASIGPRNLELTGEIADGWLAIFYSPEFGPESLELIGKGRAKVGKTLEGFDVVPTAPMVVGDDWRAAADQIRPYAAL